jgi:hypothetical protein
VDEVLVSANILSYFIFLSGDISSAFKTVDGALRLDPTNETLKKQMDKIKPQFEKQEKHRGIYIYIYSCMGT